MVCSLDRIVQLLTQTPVVPQTPINIPPVFSPPPQIQSGEVAGLGYCDFIKMSNGGGQAFYGQNNFGGMGQGNFGCFGQGQNNFGMMNQNFGSFGQGLNIFGNTNPQINIYNGGNMFGNSGMQNYMGQQNQFGMQQQGQYIIGYMPVIMQAPVDASQYTNYGNSSMFNMSGLNSQFMQNNSYPQYNIGSTYANNSYNWNMGSSYLNNYNQSGCMQQPSINWPATTWQNNSTNWQTSCFPTLTPPIKCFQNIPATPIVPVTPINPTPTVVANACPPGTYNPTRGVGIVRTGSHSFAV